MNWLYRQGYVDPTTGQYAAANAGGTIASTSWWVDFSNFFEGVGALGGGNVSLLAGNNVTNVDAVVPTNARACRPARPIPRPHRTRRRRSHGSGGRRHRRRRLLC